MARLVQQRRMVVGLALLCVSTIALNACSGSDTDDGSSTAAGEVSLTMWTFKQSHVEALQKVAEEFKAQTGTSVTIEAYTPDDAYATKVRSAANTDSLPDIISVHSAGEDFQFAQAGIITDVTDDLGDAADALYPSALTSATLTQQLIDSSAADPNTALPDLQADRVYAVPYLAGTPGLVYMRKSALSAAGLDASTPPATWEEFVAALTATKEQDPANGGLVTGLKVPQTGYYWLYRPLSYAYLGSGDFFSRNSESPSLTWDSPESVETLALYDQLTPLWADGVLNLGIDEADTAFAQGKAAADIGGTFTLSFLKSQGLDVDDLLVFPVPPAQGSEVPALTYEPSPLVSAGISATTEHRAEAVAFVQFLTSQEGATTFAETAIDLPATDLGDAASDLNPQLAAAIGTFGSPGGTTFSPNDFSADPGGGSGTVTSGTAEALAKLVNDEVTPEALGQQLADLYAKAWASSS